LSEQSVHERQASRALRGLVLFRERGMEIRPLADGSWRVPSCSKVSRFYVVSLEEESCTCADFRNRRKACKHVFAAVIAASRRGRAVSLMAELRARRAEELAEAVAEPVPEPVNEAAIRESYDLYLRVCGLYPRDGVLVEAARARHKAALQAYMVGAA
jgi:hypothetical protein